MNPSPKLLASFLSWPKAVGFVSEERGNFDREVSVTVFDKVGKFRGGIFVMLLIFASLLIFLYIGPTSKLEEYFGLKPISELSLSLF